ncbi:MAG TPA: LL-diaminopimelate aminotransferase, partial [Nitrospirota bacterium]|nr:LL-diaminopimelate aminotransferase [Nitrospirota bacterium]
CEALAHPEITDAITAKYKRRLAGLVKVLRSAGFDAKMPGGSFYLYVKAPKAVRGGPVFGSAEDFSGYLIREKLISTVPWDDAGAYIRLSATFEARGEKNEARVLAEIRRRMNDMELIF